LKLADCNPDSYRDTVQEAGIAITPYSRDRWFPATYANFSSSGYISERTRGITISTPSFVKYCGLASSLSVLGSFLLYILFKTNAAIKKQIAA